MINNPTLINKIIKDIGKLSFEEIDQAIQKVNIKEREKKHE